MYVKVPAIDGVPQVGSRHLFTGVSISPIEAVCHIEDGDLEPGWTELTGEEFKQHVPGYMLEPTEPTQPEPTEQEIINAELLLGQAQLAESQAVIEETVATILIETVKGVIA